jgi:hypothetical protein
MTSILKDNDKEKDKKEKEETVLARDKIEKCKRIKTKDEQINCMYETLHDITVAQDITNLTIMKTLNNEEDPRWIPIHMTDDANAIILEISQVKGHPKSIVRSGGYVEEKINSLNNKWYRLRWKHEE